MTRSSPVLDVCMNVPYEGAAAIGDRAIAHDQKVREHHLYRGDPLPEIKSIERLVVMGGPMSAFDDETCPWLPDVRTLLAQAVKQGTPVLGVCLGAQLLAGACGARVYRGPQSEIGAGTVHLTSDAAADPLLGATDSAEIPVFHWHGDTFDIPIGATLLASSARYPHQAFRIANAWGLQFHVELRGQDAEVVATHLDNLATVDSAALAAIEPIGAAVIDAFLTYT